MSGIIIDNCVISKVFFHNDSDFLPVRNALLKTRKRKIVYGGELRREYRRSRKIMEILQGLDRAGVAITFDDSSVDAEEIIVKNMAICVSDDEHIIALAKISGTSLLCSEDTNLHADFTNPTLLNNPRGKVYQNPSHAHLL